MPAKAKKQPKAAPTPAPQPEPAKPSAYAVWGVLAYVAIVLAVDTLAAQGARWPIRWSTFQWSAPLCAAHLPEPFAGWCRNDLLAYADLFKLAFWLVVPFLFCVWRMDWGWFGVTRWKKVDLILMAVFLILCVGAVFLVPYLPGVREYYVGGGGWRGAHMDWSHFFGGLVLTGSWLLGWEFLHRYVLLRNTDGAWPRWGWLLVPLSETLYHLQKPLFEAGGMGLFSLVATFWTRRRKNMLAAFLAHLAVEVTLLAFLSLR